MKSLLLNLSFIACLFFVAWFVNQALHHTHPPVLSGPPRLYSNQTRDDLRLYFTKSIDSAKKSVVFSIYTMTDPAIIAALKRKAREGVPVTVITDADTAAGLKEKLGPQIKIELRFLKGIMHRKILSVDGTEVWIGSANMTTESLRMHGNLVIGLADPQMAHYIEENIFIPKEPYKQFKYQTQEIEISFQPEDRPGMEHLLQLQSGTS